MRETIARMILFVALVLVMTMAGYLAIYHKRLDPHLPFGDVSALPEK